MDRRQAKEVARRWSRANPAPVYVVLDPVLKGNLYWPAFQSELETLYPDCKITDTYMEGRLQ
jgi:hypothetical protein